MPRHGERPQSVHSPGIGFHDDILSRMKSRLYLEDARMFFLGLIHPTQVGVESNYLTYSLRTESNRLVECPASQGVKRKKVKLIYLLLTWMGRVL